MGFEITRPTHRSAADAWARITDWRRHTELIPFTTVTLPPGRPQGVGSGFVARTTIGPLHFDDPMDVTFWRPPTATAAGVCRILKRGRVVVGWAVLTVTPDGPGSVVHWREEASVRIAGPLLNWPTALMGKQVFGRLVDGLLEDR